MKTGLDKLDSEIDGILQEYGNNINAGTKKIVESVGKEAKREATANAKASGIGGRKYTRQFMMQKTEFPTHESVVVGNKQYQLVHLLEKGHACRGGGRTKSKAFTHIAPAQEIANAALEVGIQRMVDNGGKN